jgi:hypothetical protein
VLNRFGPGPFREPPVRSADPELVGQDAVGGAELGLAVRCHGWITPVIASDPGDLGLVVVRLGPVGALGPAAYDQLFQGHADRLGAEPSAERVAAVLAQVLGGDGAIDPNQGPVHPAQQAPVLYDNHGATPFRFGAFGFGFGSGRLMDWPQKMPD